MRAELGVEAVRQGDNWQNASGRVRLYLGGAERNLHLGDSLEATGLLTPLPKPNNPGEVDRSAYLAERGIRGMFFVSNVPGSWTVHDRNWHQSISGVLAVLRGHGQAILMEYLPQSTAPLATTLLLGEGAPIERQEWDRYLRTGIVAVLAISGQHLVILGFFLEASGRFFGWRLRPRSLSVALFLLGYALLTGGRPPAIRAAVVVLAFALAVWCQRRTRPVNLLALAWLVVALWDPADLFTPGCQFSFLAVAVLVAYPVQGPSEPTDPLDQVLEESDPFWWQFIRTGWRWLGRVYLATSILWLVLAPLALWHYHLLSPGAILLAPPLTLLAAVSLALGFLLLVLAPLLPIVGHLLAWPLDLVLQMMQTLIDQVDALPGAWLYLPTLPFGTVLLFYVLLLVGLCLPFPRTRWQVLTLGGPIWLAVVLLLPMRANHRGELRATFLAVGHGSCVVLELPDGRVVLYDSGSLTGPVMATQVIAPFLWERGIGRIDEVFLSHADLDHFNALPALLERFAIGQVSTNTTFTDKLTPPVEVTIAALRQRRIPLRMLHAGLTLKAGKTTFEVLHPPRSGPEGSENVRSLVLRIVWGERSLLLTGDLEKEGLGMLLREPPQTAEVMMLPHHGSKRLDPRELQRWTQAEWLIACQGVTTARNPAPLEWRTRGTTLSTSAEGAITCVGTTQGWQMSTFRRGPILRLPEPRER